MPWRGVKAGAVSTAVWWSMAACAAPAGARPTEADCRSEVSRFEQAIGTVRQTSGQEAATKLKERLLPAEMQARLLEKEGYCGVARYLREKKLTESKMQF